MTLSFSLFERWLSAAADDDAPLHDGRGIVSPPPRVIREGTDVSAEADRRESALIAQIRLGNVDAFETVFRRYYGPLREFVRSMLRSDDTAGDIINDLFATLWTNRTRLAIQTSLASYLYRAARNAALNAQRGQRTHDTLQAQWAAEKINTTQSLESAADIVEREELSGVIERLLTALPERRRVAVTLRWKGGLSHAEIADVLGVNVQSVANLLNRALHDLRRVLPNDLT